MVKISSEKEIENELIISPTLYGDEKLEILEKIEYKDDAIKIELILDKDKNTLKLETFYRREFKKTNDNSKGYGIKVLYFIIKTLLSNENIRLDTKFVLETEFNCSNKIKRYYKSMSFKTIRRLYDFTDIYYRMGTDIKKFLKSVD